MYFDPAPAELAAALEKARADLGPFADLRYVASAQSTNDLALRLALAGAPEGASVLAGQQLAGRGRRGRSWFSPPDAGLYLSIVLRPPEALQAVSVLTLGAGVAVATAITGVTGLPVELKWPNDVVVGRPWRKLGGVLCEAASVGAKVDAVVVGIGVNLQRVAYPPELSATATSLETELGRALESSGLVIGILTEMRSVTRALHEGDVDRVTGAWRALAGRGLRGAGVRWREGARERRGRARDIDVDGALLVDVEGRRERVIAGEVLWEPLNRE